MNETLRDSLIKRKETCVCVCVCVDIHLTNITHGGV